MTKTGDLYQEDILQHNRDPHNFFKREDATYQVEAYNPVCGDQFQLFFDLERDRLTNLSFHGYGCAISKASASIMTGMLEGKEIKEALTIYENFMTAINDEHDDAFVSELKAFAPVKRHPGRIKCVTLSWESLHEVLKKIITGR